jgi:hypothetical protein
VMNADSNPMRFLFWFEEGSIEDRDGGRIFPSGTRARLDLCFDAVETKGSSWA